MGKRKKKSSKGHLPKETKGQETTLSEEKIQPSKEDDTPEYGGIPMRDLKKNLGCG